MFLSLYPAPANFYSTQKHREFNISPVVHTAYTCAPLIGNETKYILITKKLYWNEITAIESTHHTNRMHIYRNKKAAHQILFDSTEMCYSSFQWTQTLPFGTRTGKLQSDNSAKLTKKPPKLSTMTTFHDNLHALEKNNNNNHFIFTMAWAVPETRHCGERERE